MSAARQRQHGRSIISILILLAIIAYGVYVGMQYVPQFIESQSIGSILYSLEDTQRSEPVESIDEARDKVIRLLQMNNMDDMANKFLVTNELDGFTVTFNYDRQLDLLYEKKKMHYVKSVHLDVGPD
jgi:hypothetical protein